MVLGPDAILRTNSQRGNAFGLKFDQKHPVLSPEFVGRVARTSPL